MSQENVDTHRLSEYMIAITNYYIATATLLYYMKGTKVLTLGAGR